jgi:hypothetical protein
MILNNKKVYICKNKKQQGWKDKQVRDANKTPDTGKLRGKW